MNYDLPTIGGMFGSSDHHRFLSDDPRPQFDTDFPPVVRGTQRYFYETGIDALAAILNECRGDQRPIRLWTIDNFCGESLERLQIKLKNRIEFHRYRDNHDLQSLNSDDVLLYLHFNRYDPESQVVISGIRSQTGATVIEDFAQAPLEIAHFTGNFAITSLRKFSSLDLAIAYQGVAYPASTAETSYRKLRKEAEIVRSQFIFSPTADLEKQFLSLCRDSEAALAVAVISAAHAEEIERGIKFDFRTVQRLRRANYERLREQLIQQRISCRVLPGGYMYLMIEIEYRDRIRKGLFARRIFPAIHWADSGSDSARSILSFHIDQRYSSKDMDRTAAMLAEVCNEFESRHN